MKNIDVIGEIIVWEEILDKIERLSYELHVTSKKIVKLKDKLGKDLAKLMISELIDFYHNYRGKIGGLKWIEPKWD